MTYSASVVLELVLGTWFTRYCTVVLVLLYSYNTTSSWERVQISVECDHRDTFFVVVQLYCRFLTFLQVPINRNSDIIVNTFTFSHSGEPIRFKHIEGQNLSP